MRRAGLHGLGIFFVLLSWSLATSLGWVDPELLPPPMEVLRAAGEFATRGDVLHSTALTLGSALLSFAISVPLGLVLGTWMARSSWGALFIAPVNFLFGVPKSIFLPIFILILGIGIEQRVAFAVFSTSFILIVATIAGVNAVVVEVKLIGRAYGATPLQVLRHIYLPAMAPVFVEAMRLGFIFNMTSILLAEMYAAKDGLGTRLAAWGEAQKMPLLFAGLLWIAAISILVNEALVALERRVGAWRVDEHAAA